MEWSPKRHFAFSTAAMRRGWCWTLLGSITRFEEPEDSRRKRAGTKIPVYHWKPRDQDTEYHKEHIIHLSTDSDSDEPVTKRIRSALSNADIFPPTRSVHPYVDFSLELAVVVNLIRTSRIKISAFAMCRLVSKLRWSKDVKMSVHLAQWLAPREVHDPTVGDLHSQRSSVRHV